VKPELFTIGHSTQSREDFLGLLQRHGINAVGDVRSNPFSARLPQFNRETLEIFLRDNKVRYVFLGDELGARRAEAECYEEGVAKYDRIAKLRAFKEGLERVRNGAMRFRLALMCAEKDPLECHRTILVCRHLRDDLRIQHVLSDGRLETHAEAEARLLDEERVPTEDLFMSRDSLLVQAYEKRGGKIAYHECTEAATA
jgi:uncharacterized protein (DUF488 family)